MAKVQIDQVKGAEERNEMNVQRVVTALLHSHIDELALRNLPVDAVMEDAVIQLKETAVQILRLADDIHRVHSGMEKSPVCPVSPISTYIYGNTARDVVEMARDLDHPRNKKAK